MIVRYLPVILILAALVLALAPLEAAAQPASAASSDPPATARKPEPPRPTTAGAPVNSQADKTAVPPGADARQVRPAQAFPPERFAPSPDQTPDRQTTTPAPKDDPRGVEERPDPGG